MPSRISRKTAANRQSNQGDGSPGGTRVSDANLVLGSAGDHHEILEFLQAAFPNPSRDAFFTSLDDPLYEPTDRLLCKLGSKIVAHAHVTRREMHFGSLQLPVAGLWCLGVLPQYQHQGYGHLLLRAAEQRMARDRAVLGLLQTKEPHFFHAAGWAVCGRHCHSEAATHDLLQPLAQDGEAERGEILQVRPWRQVELPALMRLYSQRHTGGHGPLHRTEAYWRWLISRKGFDQVFVSVEGSPRVEWDDVMASIVGYVVTRDNAILELVTQPGRTDVAERLLQRACGEAVERDLHNLRYHAPPDDPVHPRLAKARGALHHHEMYQGECFMAKLFEPFSFLKRLRPELHARAKAAGLARPCELGLLLEGGKYLLRLAPRRVQVEEGKTGRNYLSLNQAEFTRLLLGHLDWDEALAKGRVNASTRIAEDTARTLFPRLPLWFAPLDEVGA